MENLRNLFIKSSHCRTMTLLFAFIMLFITIEDMKAIPQNENKNVKGIVISGEDNFPVIGANVKVAGSTLGTITDIDGNFSINVPSEVKSIEVSYIGMKTKSVTITGKVLQIGRASCRERVLRLV